jgi:signal peptidase I
MSPSSPENGDFPTVVFAAQQAQPAQPAARARSPLAVDWRMRSLGAEPGDHLPAAPAQTDQGRRRRFGPPVVKVAVLVAVAALAMLLLQAFVIQPFSVPGDAMTPTLQAGDRILVLKSGLLEGPVRRGEIVVFRSPRSLPCTVVGGRGGDLMLRVVALPGDTIWSVDGTVFLDGQPLREQGWYNHRFGEVGSASIRSTTLARGQYFVMADNRSDACDSRVFGPISTSSIVGEGIAIVGRHGHVYLGSL